MRGVEIVQEQEQQQQLKQKPALVALHLPLNLSSSSSSFGQQQQLGTRNMKQASLSAFSALDLGQTFDAATFNQAQATTLNAGNKSRARSSCHESSLAASIASSGTFKPFGIAAGQRQPETVVAAQTQQSKSERPFICRAALEGSSFESQSNNNQDHLLIQHRRSLTNETTKYTDNDRNQLIAQASSIQSSNQEQKQKNQPIETMSQTIQSIQSLSMQLNRAASLSQVSLDDMSVSQDHIARAANEISSSNSDVNGGKKLTKLVGKKAARMKEMLLQNIGKAHKTTDELFEMYEENFYKQQAQAVKIQKEFKNYMNSLKGAQDAGKSLNICIQQSTGVYQSARHDLVCENLTQLDILNEDLLDKLRGQIQVSLSEYMTQFGELREKILKRKRKLIDYDSSRRVYEIMLSNIQRKRQTLQQPQQQDQQHNHLGLRSLKPSFMMRSSSISSSTSSVSPAGTGTASSDRIQSAASQLVDEARLLKLREQYNYCKIMFETINSELYQELPMVYEKKMKHLLMTLQNYFSLEAQFHSEAGKLFATAGDVIDELPMTIHRAQQNPLVKQQQQHQQTNAGKGQVDSSSGSNEYINHHKASGSSGVGSSRGDSSLESSSSPDNSVNGSSSPTGAVDCCVPQSEVEDKAGASLQQASDIVETSENLGKEPPPSSSLSVSTIDEAIDGGDISCQLDSLSMDFGDSIVLDSVEIGDLDGLKEQKQATDDADDDLGASTSEGSSCSVIEVKPDEVESEAASKVEVEEASGCLYKVRTSYKYLAEDVDELCFEADEIIQVVEFDEGQEQEEGWLMGVREVNGQKGLFPANFTKPMSQ